MPQMEQDATDRVPRAWTLPTYPTRSSTTQSIRAGKRGVKSNGQYILLFHPALHP